MKKPAHLKLPVLKTERLLLRPFRMDDVEAVYRYASDARVAKHVRFRRHRNRAETRQAIRMMIGGGRFSAWAVTLRPSGELVGACGFVAPQWEHARGEIGYWLGQPHWGKGYATEAVEAVLQHGFGTLRLNRIEAVCSPENPASSRVLEKAGMKFEGLLRQREWLKGRFVDLRMYSLLRREWGGRKK